MEAQTTGYLTYLANTVMTANDGWQVFGADENVYKSLPLVKNMFSALGRVPLRTIFDSLDERTREAVGSLSVDAVVGELGGHHSAQGLGEQINMSLAEQLRARAEKTGGLRLDFMGADKRVRDLIASGLGKEKPIKTSDIVGKSTDVPVTDKRDGQEDVAAIELRKISGGMASDFQEATKDGIVDRGQQIISWSRANWPAPG